MYLFTERVQWYIQRMLQRKKGICIQWKSMNPFVNLYKPELLEVRMKSIFLKISVIVFLF